MANDKITRYGIYDHYIEDVDFEKAKIVLLRRFLNECLEENIVLFGEPQFVVCISEGTPSERLDGKKPPHSVGVKCFGDKKLGSIRKLDSTADIREYFSSETLKDLIKKFPVEPDLGFMPEQINPIPKKKDTDIYNPRELMDKINQLVAAVNSLIEKERMSKCS